MTDGLRHDDFRLADLRVPEPALRAYSSAGLTTVRALATAEDPPTDLDAAIAVLARDAARRFLAAPLPVREMVDLDRRLDDFLRDRRLVRVLGTAGIETVGHALACPQDDLLAIRGFGPRSLEALHQSIRLHARSAAASADLVEWLPDEVLDIALGSLPLSSAVQSAVRAHGAHCVRDLLTGRAPADPQLRLPVRRAIAAILGAGDGVRAPETETFLASLARFRAGIDAVDQQLFDHTLGLGRRPAPLARAAVALRIPHDEAVDREGRLRDRLLEVCSETIEGLSADAQAAIAVQEGVVGVDDLTLGTELHAATQASPDAWVPLRLLAFSRPDLWCFEADRLCAATAEDLRALVRTLRRALRSARPPVRVEDVAGSARETLPDCGIGLVLHVLRRVLGYSVVLRPDLGEVITVRRTSIEARLEAILEDAERSVALDDLLFRYRDRHGRGSQRRIGDALRSGPAFIEIGPRSWSMHGQHLDELELLRPEAERIAVESRRTGTRISLRDRVRRAEISERSAYLLTALLSRMPELRGLGRGEFVPRGRPASDAVTALVAEFRRAMGEVPYSRFLQNQPPQRRRLASRLLRPNRLFVSPAKDRVDLAENYPLTGDRLRMILHEVRTCVEEAGGYAPLSAAQRALKAAELGGCYLTDHLLLDILRRHGDLEILPGEWIAAPGMALGRWIQRTAREILRSHITGLTRQQIVAERPELAEFDGCLGELLTHDPLVQTEDGLHYQLA